LFDNGLPNDYLTTAWWLPDYIVSMYLVVLHYISLLKTRDVTDRDDEQMVSVECRCLKKA
jgi:hypothetical protein